LPGRRRSVPLGGQEATRSARPWGLFLIGVFDSGIGGLSVLKALRAELPQQDFIYVADSGHAPYGERDEAHVVARSERIAAWLAGQNIEALVVACNTATAAAIGLLRAAHPGLPIIGIEPALKPAVTLSKTARIGVMATRATLASAKFGALLKAQAGSASFVLQPCDGLAEAIERSAQTGDATELIAACARHLRAMGPFGSENGQIDTLVLGCTHYPLAKSSLADLLGPQVQIVDNAAAVARQLRRQLQTPGAPQTAGAAAANANVSLFSSGETAALNEAAATWLGLTASAEVLRF
jgi:glutamate racemase